MVSRRNMLKTGLTAVFGACAVQTASASEVQQKSQNNFDVVILGAGTGGLVTAIEAADLGLKPVVLEKMECSAGNSLYASGGIAAWGTSQQKEEGRNERVFQRRHDEGLRISCRPGPCWRLCQPYSGRLRMAQKAGC